MVRTPLPRSASNNTAGRHTRFASTRAQRIHWNHDLLARLGTEPDADIAETIGARVERITAKRVALRIPPADQDRQDPQRWSLEQRRDLLSLSDAEFMRHHGPALGLTLQGMAAVRRRMPVTRPAYIRWSPAMVRRLGTDSDVRVAHTLGLTTKAVTYQRRVRGIPAVARSVSRVAPLKSARASYLGKQSDVALARRWGMSPQTVRMHRMRMGIPAYQPPSRWTEELDARLANESVTAVARDAGVSISGAMHRRKVLGLRGDRSRKRSPLWNAEHTRLMGTATDAELASRWGYDPESVRRARIALGIPAFQPRSVWTPEADALLTRLDAKTLARRLGITPAMVAYRRHVLGITGLRGLQHRTFWTKERIAALRTTPVPVLAARWNRHPKTIQRARVRFTRSD